MAQSAWLSANSERDFGARGHGGFGLSPRLPPLSEIGRLNTSPSYDAPRSLSRDRRMLDYSSGMGGQPPPPPPPQLYGQHDVSGDAAAALDPRHAYAPQDPYAQTSSSQSHPSAQYTYGSYSHQSTPDLQRYRDNSSSSLSSHYGVAPGSLYPQPQFASSQSSFSSTASTPVYDLSSLSSFGNVKGPYPSHGESSLGYAAPAADPSSSLYPDHGLDRRGSNLSLGSNYDAGFQPDYGMYAPHGLQQPPRYTNEQGFEHSPSSADDIQQAIMPGVTNMLQDPVISYDMAASLSLSSTPDPSPDTYTPPLDAIISDTHFQQGVNSGDVEMFMRPILQHYVRAQNRLAFGERTIIVMSSKVAQKSYGTEKRFLCPPPTALMVGNSWWSDSHRAGDNKLRPPRVVISISGETTPPETTVDWSDSNGKAFNLNDPPLGTTYVGRCVGKQLYISDADEKRKKVEALVQVMAPSSDDGIDRVIGVFPSRPIKVISKPSKKRQSAKNLELCINHGTTVSLFHRLRSQTVSTRFLCVSGSTSAIKGSDGAPLVGLDSRIRQATPSFIARTSAWDAFVMYIVNVNHKTSPSDAPLAPPQPDFPSPPPNAIPFTNNGSPIPVYYNQTVVLQCLTSGVVSPVLVIRKVDHSTTAVGGGTPDHTKAAADHYCPPGEVCGDPVSQLHKIAFEVYDSNAVSPVTTGMPGESGAFLSCMGEKVNTYRPVEGRKWSPRPGDSPMLSPATPLGSSASFGSMADYFGGGGFDSMPPSPQLGYQSNDGGRVPRKKRSGGSSSNRSRTSRRRPASTDSLSPTASHFSDALALNPYHGAQWQVEIGETSVWTIVGVDQVRYNFYVPPVLLDNPHAPRGQSYPIPTNKVTPFPSVVKWLPADRAAEVVRSGHHWQPQSHTDQSKMLTLYGENFNKSAPPRVFFGADPSPFVEVRCNEVVGCLPPDAEGHVNQGPRRPIMLVREDGIVYPTTTMYP